MQAFIVHMQKDKVSASCFSHMPATHPVTLSLSYKAVIVLLQVKSVGFESLHNIEKVFLQQSLLLVKSKLSWPLGFSGFFRDLRIMLSVKAKEKVVK